MNQFKMTSHQFDYRAKENPFQSKQITSMLDLEQAYRRPISLEITRDMALASHADAEQMKKISKDTLKKLPTKISKETPKKLPTKISKENSPRKNYLSADPNDSPEMSKQSKIDANYTRLSEMSEYINSSRCKNRNSGMQSPRKFDFANKYSAFAAQDTLESNQLKI
jgi:hypothetical protein